MPSLFLIIDIVMGLYAASLVYMYVANKMVSISSTLKDTGISIAMLFVALWFFTGKFPWIVGCAVVMSALTYYKQLKLEARGRARMSAGK